ncbi:MAG: Chemotaxis protein CheY [Candidatus Hinthialibacteria bacterium OLB16]|nr:MAG: Chemotaxis protein CheY [Candidatus Hinthialibacteria bacterium OLB16]
MYSSLFFIQDSGMTTALSADCTLLIVDDQEDHRLLLSHLLSMSSSNYLVESCSDGKSALEFLETAEFDCIFLDYDLPDTNGIEILRHILLRNPDQGVIMVTARGNEELAVEAMKSGAADYLVKGNLKRETIDRALMRVLERKRLREVIRDQEKRLMEAERQRVMMQSIGATCHHFSQPVTSLLGRLEILLASNPPLNEKQLALLKDCLACTQNMTELLAQFQRVHNYRTVPYTSNTEILDIT